MFVHLAPCRLLTFLTVSSIVPESFEDSSEKRYIISIKLRILTQQSGYICEKGKTQGKLFKMSACLYIGRNRPTYVNLRDSGGSYQHESSTLSYSS